jgi:diguanylate cyclase (GGDEF)-like protein
MMWPAGEAWDYRVILMTQLSLFGAGWALGLAFLQEERRAMAHWCGSALAFAASIPFLQWASESPQPAAWMIHGLLLTTLAGYVLAARGVDLYIHGQPRLDRLTLGTFAVAGIVLLNLPTQADFDRLRLVLFSLAKAALLLGVPVKVVLRLKGSIGWGGATVALLPSVAYSLQGLVMAGYLLSHSGPLENLNTQMLNTPSKVIVAMVAAALFNFSFLFLLVSRLVAQLRHHASHDALTGVMNRHGFNALLDRLWQRQRGGRNAGFSLALVDVDHFKRINDEHGHPAGDEVLRRLAQVLRDNLRPGDVVARLGGEEFVLVLQSADAGQAHRVSERVRLAVEQQVMELDGIRLSVTVSTGVAEIQPSDRTAQDLLARADLALYAAKASGRNCVCIAGGDGTQPALG